MDQARGTQYRITVKQTSLWCHLRDGVVQGSSPALWDSLWKKKKTLLFSSMGKNITNEKKTRITAPWRRVMVSGQKRDHFREGGEASWRSPLEKLKSKAGGNTDDGGLFQSLPCRVREETVDQILVNSCIRNFDSILLSLTSRKSSEMELLERGGMHIPA